MSFSKEIRRELIYFFFKKILHNYDLMAKCSDAQNKRIERYGALFLSDAVYGAHWDYGELTYNQQDGYCNCHGNNVH